MDEGSLVVRQDGDAVDVVTTKRVQFRALRGITRLGAAAMAQFVWVLGYASLAELFVNRVMAGAAGAQVEVLHPHPGGLGGKTAPSGSDANFGAVLTGTMQDCRQGVSSSLDKLAAGSYGVGDYAADMVKLSEHGRRQGAALASIWAKVLGRRQWTCGTTGHRSPWAQVRGGGACPRTS